MGWKGKWLFHRHLVLVFSHNNSMGYLGILDLLLHLKAMQSAKVEEGRRGTWHGHVSIRQEQRH